MIEIENQISDKLMLDISADNSYINTKESIVSIIKDDYERFNIKVDLSNKIIIDKDKLSEKQMDFLEVLGFEVI